MVLEVDLSCLASTCEMLDAMPTAQDRTCTQVTAACNPCSAIGEEVEEEEAAGVREEEMAVVDLSSASF